MKLVSILAGAPLPEPVAALVGGVLTRDLVVDGIRWSKGRRLDLADLAALAGGEATPPRGRTGPDGSHTPAITLLVAEPGEVHEDDAAAAIAAAVAGPGIEIRGPQESRLDLVAAGPGEVRVHIPVLERLNAIDGISIFTLFDGQLVSGGTVIASVKTGPHLVSAASVLRAETVAIGLGHGRSVIEVRPYRSLRVAAVVKETLALVARSRFEATLRTRVEGLGSTLVEVDYVADDPAVIEAALRRLVRGPTRVDLVLTAGAGSTDPRDAIFVAFGALGGTVVSHGVPAHPGSMLWLGRIRGTGVLGLPTCGAYSKATAADLLLPWLIAGEPATRRTVARLGHGGLLSREMRFRFPPYARSLDAPDDERQRAADLVGRAGGNPAARSGPPV